MKKKNSKFFLNLENTRSTKTSVRRLFNNEGRSITKSKAILDELRNYYQNLYRNQDPTESEASSRDFIADMSIPILTDDDKSLCEGELSCAEWNRTEPGNDGLTPDFSNTFWNLVGQQ